MEKAQTRELSASNMAGLDEHCEKCQENKKYINQY